MIEHSLVDQARELEEVAAAIVATAEVALDTEFVREKTYYPELCLIQIATPELIACVDCLAGIDLAAFGEALTRDGCVPVMHSARQDLEVIRNLTGRLPGRLIDTQIAGALLGMPPQTSLQNLLTEILGVTIEKDQTRAEWNRRPLPAAALAYALNDVRYLLDAWRVLKERLVRSGRLGWLEEECARLLETGAESTPAAVLDKIRGVGGLDPGEQRAALALVTWREERARTADRPRKWILQDETLLRLARARPREPSALDAIEDLPAKLVRRDGDAILAALAGADGLELPPALLEARDGRRPDKVRLKAIQAAIRARADELGIAPELLATRRDAAAIEAGAPPPHLTSGWRGSVLEGIC